MSETPKTDQECSDYDRSGCWKSYTEGECVQSDFARQLERELNAANERIMRLEEAGNQLKDRYILENENWDLKTVNDWNEAKEEKL